MKPAEKTEKKFKLKHLPALLKKSAISWSSDDPWRLSAIVAYYAILSLPGLLVIIVNVVGYFWSTEIVERVIYDELEAAMGTSEFLL